MKSVLFVCLGNICRSPLGEGILRDKVNRKGLDLKIDSAGTESLHVGESPDRRSTKTAREKGIDISKQVARQIRISDFDEFDLILVADAQVYREVISMTRNETDKKKVDFMMNMLKPGSNTAVPDPYYGGQDGFEKVYDMLNRACDSLLKNLK
ncbi:MAG: low molecular weight phosphotyrosine protein phosphatase [Bacteroidetes bacterium]|nr:MAG: low molecular weight phosphotyrosine protein phosphatase [Bacteroidota bacterium]